MKSSASFSARLRTWLPTLGLLALYAAISVGTTWPLVLHADDLLITRHFDGFSTLWLMDAAPELDGALRSDRAAWPHGQVLRRADSQLLVAVAWALRPLLGPVLLFNLFVLLGPIFSAWAAEHFARVVLGARRPWSALAGLAFAFSGLSATSVLEGHAYFLLMPWLPLLATAGWRATRRGGRVRDGLLAGAMWFCCLLTSGYVGILGGIVVVALGLSALRHLRAQLRPVLAAAAVALPLGLLYTVGFVTGADAGARFHTDAPVLGMAADAGLGATASQLQAGSSGLLQLIGVRLADDVARHGIAPVLSLTMLVLAGLAGQVLPKKGTWRLFSAIGLAGLLLSLGPVIETIEGPMSGLPWLERWVMGAPGSPGTGGPPWPGYPNLPWLLFPLAYVPGDVFFHFPYRFAWLTVLGLGGVAAAVATQLAQDLGPRRFLAHGLLLAGLVDATLRPMLPQRSAQVPIGVPSAYASVVGWPGGLLELWPRPAGGATDADLLMNNLSCTYQRVHHLPMVSDCIGTGLDRSPRVRLSRVVFARVVEQRPEGLQAELAALGVGAVAVHPLLFSPEDRERLVGLLDGALGPPVAQSEDAGDPVWIYRVQGAQADRAQARLAWDRLKEG